MINPMSAKTQAARGMLERSGEPAHVLVVEDEPEVRTSLARFLEQRGYRVRSVADVESALAAARETPIAAAVLDVRLPDASGQQRSGLEVLAFLRLHEEFAQLPVLILTGYVLEEDEEETIRRHRAYVFYKPEHYATLVWYLDRLTQTHRTEAPASGGPQRGDFTPGTKQARPDDVVVVKARDSSARGRDPGPSVWGIRQYGLQIAEFRAEEQALDYANELAMTHHVDVWLTDEEQRTLRLLEKHR